MSYLIAALLWLASLAGLPQQTVPFGTGATAGSGGGATFSYVGSAAVTSFCLSSPCEVSYTPSNGNFVAVAYIVSALSSPTVAGADNGSSVYFNINEDSTYQANRYWGMVGTCAVAGSPTTIGISSSVITAAAVLVGEYSFTGGTCSNDQISTLGSGTGTSITSGSVTPSVTHSLVLAPVFQFNQAQAVTGTSPFTNRLDAGYAGAFTATISLLDRIVSSSASYSAPGTVASSAIWGSYAASIK